MERQAKSSSANNPSALPTLEQETDEQQQLEDQIAKRNILVTDQAFSYMQTGRFDVAFSLFQEALVTTLDSLGPRHSEVVLLRTMISNLPELAKIFAEAAAVRKREDAVFEKREAASQQRVAKERQAQRNPFVARNHENDPERQGILKQLFQANRKSQPQEAQPSEALPQVDDEHSGMTLRDIFAGNLDLRKSIERLVVPAHSDKAESQDKLQKQLVGNQTGTMLPVLVKDAETPQARMSQILAVALTPPAPVTPSEIALLGRGLNDLHQYQPLDKQKFAEAATVLLERNNYCIKIYPEGLTSRKVYVNPSGAIMFQCTGHDTLGVYVRTSSGTMEGRRFEMIPYKRQYKRKSVLVPSV